MMCVNRPQGQVPVAREAWPLVIMNPPTKKQLDPSSSLIDPAGQLTEPAQVRVLVAKHFRRRINTF